MLGKHRGGGGVEQRLREVARNKSLSGVKFALDSEEWSGRESTWGVGVPSRDWKSWRVISPFLESSWLCTVEIGQVGKAPWG